MSPSSLCSLQASPPISHALLNRHHKPAHDSTAGVRNRTPYVVSSERSSTASTRSADDYHATLKALNSKGRFPRKSLGQVSIFLCYVLFSENFWHDPLCCRAPKVIFFFFFEVFLWKLEGVLHRTEGGWGHGVLCLTWILCCSTLKSNFVIFVLLCGMIFEEIFVYFIWVCYRTDGMCVY